MYTEDKEFKKEKKELKGFLSEFRQALEDEIYEIEKSGQSSTLLRVGRQIESLNGNFRYQFNVEYAPTIPADTPCKLIVGKEQFDVTVISYDENFIIIASSIALPETLGFARLENGSAVLMEKLIKCIEDNADIENVVGSRLGLSRENVYPYSCVHEYSDICLDKKNDENQNNAIISAVSNDITYIWGPPGTGKTTVIGQIVDNLFKQNRSVLIVSHTNTAVDGAIIKAVDSYDKENSQTSNYPILRIGTPIKNEVPQKTLLDSHITELGKELYEQKNDLEKKQVELQSVISKCNQTIAKDEWIKENKLKDISTCIKTIDSCKKQIDATNDELNSLRNSAQKAREDNPEYGMYLVLGGKIKEKSNLYDEIIIEINNAQKNISEYLENIRSATDEIKKHSVYAELLKQEEKYMTEDFLKKELTLTVEKINALNTEINELIVNEESYTHIISEYNRKSALAKMFSGKSSVEQAQSNLQSVITRLTTARDELQRYKKLENEYKTQIDEVLILQEKKRSVVPSKTKEFWEKELKSYQYKHEQLTIKLALLIEQKENLKSELETLKARQEKTKISWNIIRDLEMKISNLEKTIDELIHKNKQEEITLEKHFKKEIESCGKFLCYFNIQDHTSLFSDMTDLLTKTKKEISIIDVDAVKQENVVNNESLKKVFEELNEINTKLQELEKQAIFNAKIVGTTLAKSYLSETLRERKFDTVILDEASMASIPALWCASYLAENNLVIVGDFLQLPPIVMSETPIAQKWLGQDIFYHSGMQALAKEKNTPDNFVMLNKQFRMESDIAEIANMYYGEYCELQSDDANEFRVEKREKFYKWYQDIDEKTNIHLIDTENLHAWVTGVPQGKKHSRLNYFSASVCVELAFKFIANVLDRLDKNEPQRAIEPKVLIVAPYKPHTSRIKQLIALEYENRGFKDDLGYIGVGTVHSMQGSEADIVIFDLVIDEPHWKANLFMPNEKVDLRKQFNVAITRAKFKLFIVGNFNYCIKHATKGNALSELLYKLINQKALKKIDAKEILPEIKYVKENEFDFSGNINSKCIKCTGEVFDNYFKADIMYFQKRLVIYSPFMTEKRLSVFLPQFADKIKDGKQIVVVTKAMSDRKIAEKASYQKMEKELTDIGINIIHKKGMHEKLIFVDDTVFWIGSLNALSYTGETGEIMMRYSDQTHGLENIKLHDIEHLCEVAESKKEQECPICENEMIIRESGEGGIYWQCVDEDYSRNTNQPYPHDGILRCDCGACYRFKMVNQPRWECTENPKHYQVMRINDLKLPKMAELLTKTERKKVDKYFQEKLKGKGIKNGAKENSAKKTKKVATDNYSQLSLFD